jgi:hypothetical protein
MKPKSDAKSSRPSPVPSAPAAQRQRLERMLAQLETHPELLEQFEKLLGLAEGGDPAQPVATVDAVEGAVVDSLRKISQQTIRDWAQAAQARAVEATQAEHPTARVKKKAR